MQLLCKQKAEFDCFLACVTTLLQKPYDELWSPGFQEQVKDDRGVYGDKLDLAFSSVGLHRDRDYWCVYVPPSIATSDFVRKIITGRTAFLQVPSLNYKNSKHIVYWTGDQLFDPSNKQVYRWLTQFAPDYIWIFSREHVGPQYPKGS